MTKEQKSGQSPASSKKNAAFFLDEYESYRASVNTIDTYASIFDALTVQLQGIHRLLDIGNGGVFDYSTESIEEIVGLDLFLDDLPENISLPHNVKMVQGSALEIPDCLSNFDGVVVVMLIHHLVGTKPSVCIENVKKVLAEAFRVLKPGGKLVIMESCVPSWFFALEKAIFIPAAFIIERTLKHPPTLQYPAHLLMNLLSQVGFTSAKMQLIPKGRHVLQFGVKVPSWITPVQPVLFTAQRP